MASPRSAAGPESERETGDPEAAGQAQAVLYDTMANREVKNRKVLDSVLTEIKQRQEHYLEAVPTKS
jgi:hypothetical protein